MCLMKKIVVISLLRFRTSLSIRFSQLLNDDAMYRANLVGFCVLMIYTSIFIHFSSPQEKSSHLMKVLGAAVFIGLMLAYSKVLQSLTSAEAFYETICSKCFYSHFRLKIPRR